MADVYGRRAVTALFLAGLATACVSPARSYDAYVAKATSTAEAVLEAVGTAQLTVRDSALRKGFSPYQTVLIAEAEKDASAAAGTFDAIQPPDARSDQLQQDLDKVLHDASGTLLELRVAARRNQLATKRSEASTLDALAKQLNDFIEAHQ